MKKIIIIVGIVVVVVGGLTAYMLTKNDAEPEATTSSQTTTTDPESTSGSTGDNNAVVAEGASITYNGSSFTPSTQTVKAGTIVTVQNNSSSTLDFASNDHPTHKINSELNVGDIAPGESGSFTARAGTWGFHDHDNADATGTITVQ